MSRSHDKWFAIQSTVTAVSTIIARREGLNGYFQPAFPNCGGGYKGAIKTRAMLRLLAWLSHRVRPCRLMDAALARLALSFHDFNATARQALSDADRLATCSTDRLQRTSRFVQAAVTQFSNCGRFVKTSFTLRRYGLSRH